MAKEKKAPETAVEPYSGPPAKSVLAWNMPTSLTEAIQVAEIIARSNAMPDIRNAGVALLKMLAGAELGFGPFASLTGVHIIGGMPRVGANLMASLIKQSKRHDYKVIRCDREACVLDFYTDGEQVGQISLTMQEAVASGLAIAKDGKTIKDNWSRSTDDMLFADCIRKGYRRYFPDLTGGVAVYDPDEPDRSIEEATVTVQSRPLPASQMPAAMASAPTLASANPTATEVVRRVNGEVILEAPAHDQEMAPELVPLNHPASEKQVNRVLELAGALGFTSDRLVTWCSKTFARPVEALSGLTSSEAGRLIEKLQEQQSKTQASTTMTTATTT